MSLLSWNCRGLGTSSTVQVLMDLAHMKNPMVIFLMETMINDTMIEVIKAKLNYEGLFTVAGLGHGGGLEMLWKYINNVHIKSFSQIILMLRLVWMMYLHGD